MNILAFDTASPRVSVALERSDGERAERGIVSDRPRHVEDLVPMIDALLSEMSVVRSEIGRIVVGIGPGQFNGLRVGVTTAEMLHRVWGCELVGVSTLESMAWTYRREAPEVVALLDARRRAAYIGRYRTAPWVRLDAEEMLETRGLGEVIGDACVVATPSIAAALDFAPHVDWPSPLAMIEVAADRSAADHVGAVYVRPAEESI